MAKKNLLAMSNGEFYNSMKAVEQNVVNYENLVSGITSPESDYIQELTTKLETLLSTLRAQEAVFYSRLGIKGAEQLRNLQDKVNQWDNMGAKVLLQPSTVQGVFNCVASTIDEGQFLDFVNTYLGNSNWLTEEKAGSEEIEEGVVEFFNRISESIMSDKKKMSFNKGVIGLEGQIELTKVGGKYQVKVLKNSKVSNGMKRKLLKLITAKAKENPTINKSTIEKANALIENSKQGESVDDRIIYFLKSVIPNQMVIEYVSKEVKSGNYARFANYNVIQGYLGEVYWNSCMRYLFGSAGDVRALGDTDNLRGKSLSVDMFAEGAGFQIKAWSLKQAEEDGDIFETHTTTTKMYFGNFLQDRAQILNEMTGQVIARLFGSISYNLPNEDKNASKKTEGNSEPYSKFYSRANSEWPDTMDELALLFRANLSEILGISGQNALAKTGQQYYNTFWAINNKIVPSSLIIEELISSIRSVSDTKLVDLSVNLKNSKTSPVWDTPPSDTSDLVMANRWKIEYSTCFNMTRLLEAAAQKT